MKRYDVVPGLEFDPESDFEISPAWFLDATHSVPPWTPMFAWFWVNFCRHGMQHAAETLNLPTVKGWDWRFYRGGGYLAVLTVNSPEERQRREDKFRQAILPLIRDYDGVWSAFLKEIFSLYEEIKTLDVERASSIELLNNFEMVINTCRRMWEIHMYMMYGTYTAYILFEKMCHTLAGIDDTCSSFHSLVAGFDNKVFQVDRRLWEFSIQARDQGLSDIFLKNEPSNIEANLKASEKGHAFWDDFQAFLLEDGWRMQRMAEVNEPTWIEDPTPALSSVKQFLLKGTTFNLEEERKQLVQERHKAEQEVLYKIPFDQRDWFKHLMQLAQKSGVFSEEHDHYLDLYTHALIRRTALGIGQAFARAGTIDHPDDIFFLIPDEIRKVGLVPDHFDLRQLIQERKTEWEQWKQEPNPPALLKEDMDLDMGMKMLLDSNDPIALKVVVGKMSQVRPELNADLYGTCGSPGVAEGIARVVINEEDLYLVRQGDILVSTTTAPSWTPVFPRLKGVVMDRGASLSHAAIVGREYRIPVILNVFEGTTKIKSGQRIKIDANLGVVYILNDETGEEEE